MANIEIAKGDGGMAAVDAAAVDELKSQLKGKLLQPGDGGYDEARTIWNDMIDRRQRCLRPWPGDRSLADEGRKG